MSFLALAFTVAVNSVICSTFSDLAVSRVTIGVSSFCFPVSALASLLFPPQALIINNRAALMAAPVNRLIVFICSLIFVFYLSFNQYLLHIRFVSVSQYLVNSIFSGDVVVDGLQVAQFCLSHRGLCVGELKCCSSSHLVSLFRYLQSFFGRFHGCLGGIDGLNGHAQAVDVCLQSQFQLPFGVV